MGAGHVLEDSGRPMRAQAAATAGDDRLPARAANLVDLKVDVIVASGNVAPLTAKNATSAIPIVFTGGDPVAAGLVASLARPGGNLTGFSLFVGELMPKRLELLSDLVPQARSIALLVNPKSASTERTIRDLGTGRPCARDAACWCFASA